MKAVMMVWALAMPAVDGEVNQDEVLRWGDRVQRIGGVADAPPSRALDALAPPADDSAKWFVSIVSRPSPMSQRLLADWRRTDRLLAIAVPGDQKRSWCHLNIYDRDDQSQSFRWAGIEGRQGPLKLPAIIVQPPRTGDYGDPRTVVALCQYRGDPYALADIIIESIVDYVASPAARAIRPRPPPAPPDEGQIRAGQDQPVDAPIADTAQAPWQPRPGPGPGPPPLIDPLTRIPPLPTRERLLDSLAEKIDQRMEARQAAAGDQIGRRVEQCLTRATDQIDDRLKGLDGIQGRLDDRLESLTAAIVDQIAALIPWGAIAAALGISISAPIAIGVILWVMSTVRESRRASGSGLLLDDATYDRLTSTMRDIADEMRDYPADTPARSRRKTQTRGRKRAAAR